MTTLQAERLYEALCTERSWAYDDWDRYLRQHPVMRHLTQRLAWTATTDDAPGMSSLVFRPLDDGTLTDVDDEEVTVAPQRAGAGRPRLATSTPNRSRAWQSHFADYEVTPLFQQLGKGTFELPDEQADAQEIDDFKGHLRRGVRAARPRGEARLHPRAVRGRRLVLHLREALPDARDHRPGRRSAATASPRRTAPSP